MDEKSSDLTTFVCPLGKYKYVRMSFGLKNAPAIFQAAVEAVLSPVNDISCNYVDNVVVYSDSWENHLSDLLKKLFNVYMPLVSQLKEKNVVLV